MNKKFGVFVFLGLLIGATFGVFFGAALNNPRLGVALGAVGGLFIGWYIFAAISENQKKSDS